MQIFDLHTHILPNVDDGAKDMQEALEMLNNAVASDVTDLVVTPHSVAGGAWENFRSDELLNAFKRLKKQAENIPINLYLGAEVHINDGFFDCLKARKFKSLNDSRYLLTEFGVNFDGYMFCDVLKGILSEGYIPLIAHPERYTAVIKNPQIVEEWLDLGCHIQLTGGSIMGVFGKKVRNTAEILLKNDLVCCVASDAHGTNHRSGYLLDVCTYLSLYFGKQYAKILMWENPKRICENIAL